MYTINSLILIIILLAILPHFIIFVIYSRMRPRAVLVFILGGVLWLGALLLRSPLLQLVIILYFLPTPIETVPLEAINAVSISIWYVAFSSLMAGIFEEVIRFIAVKKIKLTSRDNVQLTSFGLGWGLTEAFLLHTLTLIPYLASDFSDPIAFIGAIERLIVITFHVAMTFVVYKCVKENNNLWALVAILLHFGFDFIGVLIALYVNLILAESVFAAITILIIVFLRKDYTKNPPSLMDETRREKK
ncbi:MAG: YhfC family glutamic-type intramembrane protease [Promethearchaeota archaeon]